MMKITIISCIVAVCVFQTAEAGIFLGKNPLIKLPNPLDMIKDVGDNVQNKVTDSIGKVKELGDNMQKQLPNPLEGIKEVGDSIQKEISDSMGNMLDIFPNGLKNPACTNIFSTIQSNFYSCMAKSSEKANTHIKSLKDAVKNLKTNLPSVLISEPIQDATKCFQNPLKIMSCMYDVLYKMSKNVFSLLGDITNKAYDLTEFFPIMNTCYQDAFSKAITKKISDLPTCINGLMNLS